MCIKSNRDCDYQFRSNHNDILLIVGLKGAVISCSFFGICEAYLVQTDEEKKYESVLLAKGIKEERIRKYGFAFEGQKVLIG